MLLQPESGKYLVPGKFIEMITWKKVARKALFLQVRVFVRTVQFSSSVKPIFTVTCQ